MGNKRERSNKGASFMKVLGREYSKQLVYINPSSRQCVLLFIFHIYSLILIYKGECGAVGGIKNDRKECMVHIVVKILNLWPIIYHGLLYYIFRVMILSPIVLIFGS